MDPQTPIQDTQPVAQPTPQSTMWNPIDAVKEKYPAMGLSDQQVYQNLSDPAKFRSAFPEYSGLQDTEIQNNMAKIGLKYPQYKMPAPTTVGSPSTQPMQPSLAGKAYDILETGGQPVSKSTVPNAMAENIEHSTAGAVGTGALKGGLQTVHTGLRVANAVTGDNLTNLPTSFKQPESLQPQGTAENIGYTAENVAEFLMGDELLKEGATAASAAPKVAKALKAIEETPVLRNQIVQRMAREGFVAGAQSFAHTGDATQAVEQGAATAGMSGIAGAVSKPVGDWLRARGFAGDVLGRAATILTKDIPKPEEVLGTTQTSLNTAEDAMHDSYDKFITGFRDKVGDEVVALKDTPLFKAATDIKNANSNLPSEIREGLAAVTPQSSQLTKLIGAITDAPSPDASVNGNYLVDLRQGLNRSIKSADPVNRQVLGHLLDSVDETLDKLVSGSSDEYTTARKAYKATLDNFKQPFVKAIRDGKIADVANSITTGANPEYKIKTLRKLVGDDAINGIGMSRFVHAGQDALDDDGQHLDVKKFVSGWRSIKQSVRDELFRTDPNTLNDLNSLVDNAKRISKTANLMKWGVRAAGLGSGILGAVGLGDSDKDHPVSPYAYMEIMGGLLGMFGGGKTHELTESLMTSPKVLNALGKLGGYNDYRINGQIIPATSSTVLGQAGKAIRGGVGANVTHLFDHKSGTVVSAKPDQQ